MATPGQRRATAATATARIGASTIRSHCATSSLDDTVRRVGQFDYLAAYTAAADYLSGVGLLSAPDTPSFAKIIEDQWLPAMGKPGAYTERGAQFDSVVKYLTGGDLAFREQGLAQFYTRDLSRFGEPAAAPPSAPGRRALNTRNVTFEIDPG